MPTGIGDEVHWYCPTLAGSLEEYDDLQGTLDSTGQGDTSIESDTNNGGSECYEYDGTGDWCSTSASASFSTTYSISVWVKPTTSNANRCWVGTDNANGYCLFFTTSGVFHRPAGSDIISFGGYQPTLDVWTHYVITRSGTTILLYKDGSQVSAPTYSGSDAFAFEYFGAKSNGGFPSIGRLDDLRIFDVELSSGDVAELYDSGNGRGYEPSAGGAAFPFHRYYQGVDIV